jgi:anti-sigma regulatory factor (Ser/Thr protein kinase)
MPPSLNLLLPAVPANVATARRAIGGLCEHLDIHGQAAGDICLAVSEACTACVEHSRGVEGQTTLAIDASVEGDALLVVVRDFAGGLVRGPIRGGNRGLGMRLVRRLAQQTDVSSLSGGGLRVAMSFAAHPSKGTTHAGLRQGEHGAPRSAVSRRRLECRRNDPIRSRALAEDMAIADSRHREAFHHVRDEHRQPSAAARLIKAPW